MAQTTRDSFQDTANYTEVTFQYRKDVLDSELNELQKIWRSQLYKGYQSLLGGAHVIANGTGGLVSTDGVTANTIQIGAGFLIADGYAVYIGSTITVAGLTTPGSSQLVNVWMGISETEVNSSVDSVIAVAKLGETTVRKKISTTFFVDQGGVTPPSSSAAPYLGGTQWVLLAEIQRQAATAIINPLLVVDLRSRSVAATMAQDRNLIITAGGISWDGTTLVLNNLKVRLPNEANVFDFSSAPISITPADGQAFGWLATVQGNKFRRNLVGTVSTGSGPGGTSDLLTPVANLSALTQVAAQFAHSILVLGTRIGTQIVFRDGTVMNVGDYVHSWGSSGGYQAVAESNVGTVAGALQPLQQYRAYNGKMHATIDHLGFRGGQLSEVMVDWNKNGAGVMPDGWTATVGTSSVATCLDPSATFTQRYLAMQLGNPAAFTNVLVQPNALHFLTNDSVVVLEHMVQPPATLQVSASDSAEFGILFSNAGANNSKIRFFYNSTNTDWRCQVVSAGAVTQDTASGVTVVASTTARLRLEIVGSNNSSAAAGTFTARFFINGVLVKTLTWTAPAADKIWPYVGCASTTGNTIYVWIVGRMRFQFNHLLTADPV